MAAFTAGNLVALRIGNGSAGLTTAATPVFLDEYNSSGAFVQSIALPTSDSGSQQTLTLSGTAFSEGALALSSNHQYLTLAGYDAPIGTASVAKTLASDVPRTVGRIALNATIDTTTSFQDGYTSNSTGTVDGNIRSAVTDDGTRFWLGGTSASGLGGTRFISFGGSTSTQLSTSVTNTRVVGIFGDRLYTSSSSGASIGINTVGTGLPTTPGQTTSLLPGLTTSDTTNSYGFVLLDRSATVSGLDTLYVADQGSGLKKFSFDGSNWTSRGTIAGQLTGLTGYVDGSQAILYATNGTGAGNKLVKFTDSQAFDSSLSGSLSDLATAGTNKVFRGLAFSPGTVFPQADLSVSVSAAPSPLTVGQVLIYNLTASNLGAAIATGVKVNFTLPTGLNLTSATVAGSGTGFTPPVIGSSGTVSFSGGTIAPGSSVILTLGITPTTVGTLTSGTAAIDPDNTLNESNEANNSASALITLVNPVPSPTPSPVPSPSPTPSPSPGPGPAPSPLSTTPALSGGELILGTSDTEGVTDLPGMILRSRPLPRLICPPFRSHEIADGIIMGGAGEEEQTGSDRPDDLHGRSGQDVMLAGSGQDNLWGDRGDDRLFGNREGDVLHGGPGQDQARAGRGSDAVWGGKGSDWLWGDRGNDLVVGDRGDDELFGDHDEPEQEGAGNDLLFGQDGDDRLFGQAGDDSLSGGAGRDSLWGGRGADLLIGDGGDDWLLGDLGEDSLVGDDGADIFWLDARGGEDWLFDFTDGIDRLGGVGWEQVQVVASGDDTRLWVGGRSMARLLGVEAGAIDAGDFV